MKNILILFGVFVWISARAQSPFSSEIISTAGAHYENAAGKLSWTIGECAVETFSDTTNVMTQGFHQPNCGTRSIVGEITGCDLLCAGDTSHTYIYEVSAYPDLISYDWSISPVGAANIMNSTPTSIELEFPNIGITSCNLRFTPSDECGDGEPVNFVIALDTACVWPGDINNDGMVDWGADSQALLRARAVFENNYNTSPMPPMRPTSCITTDIRDWEPYAAISWDSTYDFKFILDFHEAKYADANGNGIIEEEPTIAYFGPTSANDTLPIGFTDMDAVVYFGNELIGGTHNGNNHKQNPQTADIKLVALDSVLVGGDELRLMVLIGNDTNIIANVNSIALKVGFTLGTYKNPAVWYDYSHLAPYPWLRLDADYPASIKVDSTDSEWWLAASRRDLQTVDFAGEELCRLVCEVPIAGWVDSTSATNKINGISIDTVEVEITIIEAAYIENIPSFQASVETLKYLGSNTITVNVVNQPILYTKAFLAGSYDQNNGLIHDGLRQQGLVPYTEPYTALGYEFIGGGGETIDSIVLDTTGNEAIVDWVILELRDKDDLNQKIASRSCLIQRDGDIVDLDGTSPVKFKELPNDSYYIIVRHRNHLPVMSSTPVPINRGYENSHDFTVLGSFNINPGGQSLLSPNVWGMSGGDADLSQSVEGVDKLLWSYKNGTLYPYELEDFNMDGSIDGLDKTIYSRYNGTYSGIPK